MSHRFFAAPPPKSLDRNAFSADAVEHLSTEDGAATLTAFTAAAIAAARCQHARAARHLGDLRRRAQEQDADEHDRRARRQRRCPGRGRGFDGDAVEAEAWAYLAVRSLQGWPITFPGTTGVPADDRR